MLYAKLFCISLPILSLLDFIWLGIVMSKFYNAELGTLARRSGDSLSPNWPTAIMAYILMAVGLTVFVLPRCADKSMADTFIFGAIFGLVMFGIYDFTNYATLAGWSLKLTIADICWGMTTYGISSVIAGLIARRLRIL